MVFLAGLPLRNTFLTQPKRTDVCKLDIPQNWLQKKPKNQNRAGDETETNLETLTVAQRLERHRLRVQREKTRLGNQEKSHEDVSHSHMTSGIQ